MINMCLQIFTILPIVLFSLLATTQAKDDKTFECVDVYKQPSFQHPLLKNNTLQIISLKRTRRSSICPRGMVPIHNSRNNNVNNSLIARDALIWATLDTKAGNIKYHGAGAVSSIHNPTPFSGTYSKAQIWIESGSPQGLNSIQFGWAVHPELYRDNLVHFTTYWTSDGGKTGCYNTACQGFVQDFSDLYPGIPLDQVSTYDGEKVEINLSIIQDGPTGNWMLMRNNGALVGYWPKELFTSLGSGADSIRYGGITAGGAPMGNGRFPDVANDLSRSSYFKEMRYVDANSQSVPINGLEMNVNTPNPNCYKLNYLRDSQIITYGGGSCPN